MTNYLSCFEKKQIFLEIPVENLSNYHQFILFCGDIDLIILFMIRICTKQIRFKVSVPRIDFTPTRISKDLKIDFYPIVGIRERKLGACIFNQPANQNLLTQEFVDQLYRFLLSYQYDNTVENVWIQSKDNVFSHGVDYKRLKEDKNYLDKLYKLAILFANFNKPTFAQVAGGVKGAGAYLLSMINMPLGYSNTYLKLDEVSRGLVPLLGGSHRLANMPLNLGFFLALVGEEFNAEQMAQLGLLQGSIPHGVSNSQIRQKLHEANLYFRQKFRYMDFDGVKAKLQADEQFHMELQQRTFKKELKYFQAQLLAESPRNVNVRFAANQHLISRVNYQNIKNPYSSFSENESGRTINNYYQMRFERPLKYLFQQKVINPFKIDGIQLKRLDLGRIDIIFGKQSLVQVLQALKQENAQWAQRAYIRITQSDPLAALLTFKLIKEARTSSWVACIQRQFSVARRLLQISKLKLRNFQNSSHYVLTNAYSEKKISQIKKSIIDNFFVKPQMQYKLHHQAKQNSLLPACDYYKDVPDSIRAYLNQTEFVDKHYTQQLPQIKRYLKQNHINYKSKVYDVQILRQKVYERLEIQKEKNLFTKRLNYFAHNDRYLQIYKNLRENHLQSISSEKLKQMIFNSLSNLFKKRFKERYSQFEKKTANVIGLEKKLQFFKSVKNIILSNLLYKGYDYEQGKNGKAEFNGLIYFDPSGKDIYSSTNPYLKQDKVLNQLTKDFAKGTAISKKIDRYLSKTLPKFFATKDQVMPRQAQAIKMQEEIKERYDQKPDIWAEAYTYKELIEQASRTSQELAGYLDWTFENFHDLIAYTERGKETYGQYTDEIVNEVKKMRDQKKEKLKQVKIQYQNLTNKRINSKIYQFKNQQKMRKVFPFYYNEFSIPFQFRRCFLSVLDSTLQEFTVIHAEKNENKLLIKQELGVLDRWINHDLTYEYTQFLKYDVEYVTSYLMILFVKDMLSDMTMQQMCNRSLKQTLAQFIAKYNVDFNNDIQKNSSHQINRVIIKFLYFLVDMHTNAKMHIKSPQSKLIDFINRLKTAYQFRQDRSLPYSFQGLLLLIGKDRKKMLDAFLGQKFIAQPEFLLQYITREAKKTSVNKFIKEDYQQELQGIDVALKTHFNQHYNSVAKSKHLIQNYFYYMMLFQKHIHQLCGKESFIPENFVNPQHQVFNKYCQNIMSSDNNQEWVQKEINAVIQQLLNQRLSVQQKLTKGQLLLYDQKFSKQLQPQRFKKLIKDKLTQEIFMIKNMFSDRRQYQLIPSDEEASDLQYTKIKRTIKNPEALKKLNNLSISQQVYLEYMNEATRKVDLSDQQKKFVEEQRIFFKKGMCTRLPFKSYHRMARDVFIYPQDMVGVPQTEHELNLYKKTNINFKRALSGEKINLSPFSQQYKQLTKEDKSDIIKEMVRKINMVESL